MWGRLISQNEDVQSINLEGGDVVLGRGATCNVVLDFPAISKKHCRFFCERDCVFVEDLSGNGTFVNKEKVGKDNRRQLRQGNEICVQLARNNLKSIAFIFSEVPRAVAKSADPGPTLATQMVDDLVESAAAANEPSPLHWGRLVTLNPNYSNINLSENETIIGRNLDCTVHISLGALSGKHCRVYRDNGLAFVEDLSTNGTYVNGVKLGKNKKKLLKVGDEITILMKNETNDLVSYVYNEVLTQSANDEGGLLKKYDLGQVLGTGNFAAVKLCVARDSGDRFAAKCIDKKKFKLQQPREGALMDEVNILKRVKHTNVICIEEMFETEETLYLVLEFVSGGELFDLIVESKCLPEEQARPLFKQMLEGVAYIHSQGIAHRDLKPENILLKSKTDHTIKISDFGLSRVISEGSFMGTLCGTPQYIAPEILTKAQKKGYDKAVDLWSLGVILYVILSGMMPFNESDSMSIYDQIRKGRYFFPDSEWAHISNEAKELIKSLMCVDVSKRLTAVQALEHQWITGVKPGTNDAEDMDSQATEPEPEEMEQEPTPAASTTPKGKKPAAAGKLKAETYEKMVTRAIAEKGEVQGTSLNDIKQFIEAEYDVGSSFVAQFPKQMEKLKNKKVVTLSGGRYKLK